MVAYFGNVCILSFQRQISQTDLLDIRLKEVYLMINVSQETIASSRYFTSVKIKLTVNSQSHN